MTPGGSAEKTIRDSKRRTRRKYSAEQKIYTNFVSIMTNKNIKNIILESGMDIINQVGPRFFTVEYLVQKLQISKKTIYKYFPSKDKNY